MLKRIIQQHENGCVSASIAMLANVSYVQGVRLVHPFRKPWSPLGANREQRITALKRAGFKLRNRKWNTPFTKLKHNALIVILTKSYDSNRIFGFHAVVWDFEAQKIRDPYPSPRRHMKRHLPQSLYQKYTQEIIEVY